MKELIIIGKNNPDINPHLHLWHWPISIYLFLGGMAAGILFFSSLYFILGKDKEMPAAVKWASFIAPPALIIGLGLLFLDLHNKIMFWRLYTTIKLSSPMSWGAWTLLVVTPLSILWSFRYFNELFPGWIHQKKILIKLDEFLDRNRIWMAWPQLILSVVLGIYTGILLSAFNARPLWNTSILGVLFLVSGLSTAAVLVQWISKQKKEKNTFGYIDLGLIGLELFLIIHLFMGLLAGPDVQVSAAQLFLGGPYTLSFWIVVVMIGLLIPAALEILEIRGKKIPAFLVPILVLLGGLIFRIIIVNAGQLSSYSYLGG